MASPTLYNLHHAQTFPAVAPHVSVQPDLSPCRLQTRHLAVAGWPGDFSPTRANAYATPRFRAEVAQPLRPPSLMPTGPDAMKDGVFEAPALGWQLSRDAAAYVRQRQQLLLQLRAESLFAFRMPGVFRAASTAQASQAPQLDPGPTRPNRLAKGLEACESEPWMESMQKGLASTWQNLMSSVDALSGNWCMHDETLCERLKPMSRSGFDEPWFARTTPTVRPDTPGGQASPFLAARAPFLKVDDEVQANVAQQGQVQQPLSQPQTQQILQLYNCFMVSLKGNKSTAPNQDRASIVNFGKVELLTLCDGHGEVGHDVAEVCCEVLPKLLLQHVARVESGMSPGVPNAARNPQEAAAALSDVWCEAAVQTFLEMHRLTEALTALSLDGEAGKAVSFDARCSGATATTLVLSNDRIFVAHVGDSRAVLGFHPPGGQWMVRELTRDHKPELPEERSRIERTGAQVISVGQQPNVTCRVYSHQQAWPSINMSRSLGDLHAHSQGLIAEPQVNLIERSWDASSRAVVIVASDGLWDVIDSFTAVTMAWESFEKGTDPGHVLSQEAYARWGRRGLQAGYSDDISIIVRIL